MSGNRWTQEQIDEYNARSGKARGGLARRNNLTPERRSEIAAIGGAAHKVFAPKPIVFLDNGPQRMNKLEARYWHEVLEPRRKAGDITWCQYEPFKLQLAPGAWFTPDFGVITSIGRLEFHETKGFWREAARVRIKVAARLFPFRFIAITHKQSQWQVEEFLQ